VTKMIISGKNTGDLIGSTLVKSGRQVVKFHAMDGFGLPRHLINNPRVKNIRLHYQGLVYKTTAEMYRTKGIPYHRPPYEPQLVLPRNLFNVVDSNQTELIP